MTYTDRPTTGQRVHCARHSRLITTIRRTTGSILLIPLGKE